MDHEIKMMNAYKRRLGQTGPVITKIHNDFINRPTWTLN